MTEKKHTVAIGDVHGLINWKEIVENNPGNRFVFLGDYLDPYEEIAPYDLLRNLLEIIEFKEQNKEDVILLLGNHDMHYIYEDFPEGTRYDSYLADIVKGIFEGSRDLFQFAYQEGDTLYTHAGISKGWWENDFKPLIEDDTVVIKDGFVDIASLLNHPTKPQLEAMFQVGYCRGGDTEYGGIFWADRSETSAEPLPGINQVVGHSRVPSLLTVSPDADTSITYCDCLFMGEYYSE